MTKRKKLIWRTGVIAVGLAWSAVLWHQQALNLDIWQSDQESLLSKADKHSDLQISAVRRDLQSSTSNLDVRLSNLSNQVSKSETDISGSIKQVIAPPRKIAHLRFGFFTSNADSFPVTKEVLSPDKSGVFIVNFISKNVSSTAAVAGDIWVHLCKECAFAREPQGFDRPSGTPDSVRHTTFAHLNANVFLQEMTVAVKLVIQPLTKAPDSFEIGFRYACETCGKIEREQVIKVFIAQPLFPPRKPRF